jgi:histone H3/H4
VIGSEAPAHANLVRIARTSGEPENIRADAVRELARLAPRDIVELTEHGTEAIEHLSARRRKR